MDTGDAWRDAYACQGECGAAANPGPGRAAAGKRATEHTKHAGHAGTVPQPASTRPRADSAADDADPYAVRGVPRVHACVSACTCGAKAMPALEGKR